MIQKIRPFVKFEDFIGKLDILTCLSHMTKSNGEKQQKGEIGYECELRNPANQSN